MGSAQKRRGMSRAARFSLRGLFGFAHGAERYAVPARGVADQDMGTPLMPTLFYNLGSLGYKSMVIFPSASFK